MPVIISKWKKPLEKVCKIYENDAQNLQVTCAEFTIFWRRILTTLLLFIGRQYRYPEIIQ